MIARDEAHCIGRALASLRGWVDELWVLDTGSHDDTVAVAQAAGAHVGHFTWCDDFSAARNAALALAQADWHIVVDADEWLTADDEAMAALRQQAPDFVGSIEVDSDCSSRPTPGPQSTAPQTGAPAWLPRVLPGSVRYAGRIHEHPAHGLPVCRLPVRLGHDGYLPEAMQRKGDRNHLLLTQALREHPDDAYLLYQLGKDHEVHDRFEAASRAYEQALPRVARSQAYRHDLVIRQMFVLQQCGQLAQAIHLAEAEMAHFGHSADFHFTMGDVLLSHAVGLPPADAQEVLPLIEACWLRCLELGDTLDLEGAVKGRGSHLAAHNLVVFYDSLGLTERADPWRAVASSSGTH
jgi:hypothetical protein